MRRIYILIIIIFILSIIFGIGLYNKTKDISDISKNTKNNNEFDGYMKNIKTE